MTKSQDDKFSWVSLYLVSGLGNTGFLNLLNRIGDPSVVLDTSLSELMNLGGLREDVARRIVNREFVADPDDELAEVDRLNARIVTYADPSYPAFLKQIHYPPMLFYLRGNDLPVNKMLIAVVGSRHATHYGLNAARAIGGGLAERGIGVVSGLAKGIDSAAHAGCLKGNGFTIAVMGTGIDTIYPPANRSLSEQIIEKGALISEFPIGTPPEAKNFPIRNRIISGLSRGVVVVEATKKSGSLITSSYALDQGREIFAVPGSINSFKSRGSHSLIKKGAKLVENADDIVSEFFFEIEESKTEDRSKTFSDTPPDMDAREKKVYEILGDYPIHIDQIVRTGEMDPGEVLSILMKMELKGIVRQMPGKMFLR
ncbi:MAG: DNA-processing protein DprA [Desulfatiglans sp.]|jgi:DNA processing protein|nr:DNA-processing protein DprA [Thermodesulfobacteriota bacterium]MEE4353706.1 DNA-processing protein DprA [Desulfatiglans sp.]